MKSYYLVPLSALKHGTNHMEHVLDMQLDEFEAGAQLILVKPLTTIIQQDRLAVKVELGQGHLVEKP